MSKRGNDNQLTKDEYDRDQDDDSSSVMGTFKQASSDEMSRRVIKAPRARKLGSATESGPKPFAGFSGFTAPATSTGGFALGSTAATMSAAPSAAPTFSFAAPPTSSAATSQPASTSGGFSFGVQPSALSATSQPTPSTFSFGVTPKPSDSGASAATSTPPAFSFGGSSTSFGGFGKPAAPTTTSSPFSTPFSPIDSTIKAASSSSTFSFAPKETATKPEKTSVPTFSIGASPNETLTKPDATSASSFSFGAPPKESTTKSATTFSFGSSSTSSSSISTNPFASQKDTTPVKKSVKDVQEDEDEVNALIEELSRDLNNDLTDLNNKFSEKILKELKKNSQVNLASLFSQYTSHRRQVKTHYLDLVQAAESGSIENESESERSETAVKLPGSMPKISFGIPSSNTASTIKEGETSRPTFSGGFNFGGNNSSSAMTATPAFGGFGKNGPNTFSFGAPAPAVKSPSEAPKSASSGGFSFSIPTPTKESSTSLFATPASSSSFNATTTASASSSAPFSTPFSFSPKPFSFNPPAASGSPSGTVTPAPFTGFSAPTSLPVSQSGESGSGGDNAKLTDDTKSELVDSREGEEGEETVLEVRAKLYGVQDGEHKDLGVGQFRINENKESKKRRMIMRTSGTGMLTLNSWVIQGMGPKREKNTVTIFGIEDSKPKRFLLRVKEEHSALDIFQELEKAQQK